MIFYLDDDVKYNDKHMKIHWKPSVFSMLKNDIECSTEEKKKQLYVA